MRQALTPSFLDVVKSFYGCTGGNIDSPVWLCGLEWGGGFDLSYPYPMDGLACDDFESLQVSDVEHFRDLFWAPRSSFCRSVIKILLAIRHGDYNGEYTNDFKTLEDNQIVGENGLALILNACPISLKNRQNIQDWSKITLRRTDGSEFPLREWSGCQTFNEYVEFVQEHRFECFEAERRKRRPKIIVACGDDAARVFLCKEDWENREALFGEGMRISSRSDNKKDVWCRWLKNNDNAKEDTLLVWQPFPGSRAFNANEQFKNTYTEVCKMCQEHFEDADWLEHSLTTKATSATPQIAPVLDALGEACAKAIRFKEDLSQAIDSLEKIKGHISTCLSSEESSRAEATLENVHSQLLKLYPSLDELYSVLRTHQKDASRLLCETLRKI